MSIKNRDKIIATAFFALTLLFVFTAMNCPLFFEWVFERHQSPWSWYIRPLFLIPFCYFAYRHSWAGISITIFGLLTSMFWFNRPSFVPDEVKAFLVFEKEWLYGTWTLKKILMAMTVPVSFTALGLSFWKRSLPMGLCVVILMATGKIIWSISSAGESGKSVIVPALAGLGICVGLIYYGYKRLEKKAK